MVTTPSGLTLQLAPSGTPPSSPIAFRVAWSAAGHVAASTVPSYSESDVPSRLIKTFQCFIATCSRANVRHMIAGIRLEVALRLAPLPAAV